MKALLDKTSAKKSFMKQKRLNINWYDNTNEVRNYVEFLRTSIQSLNRIFKKLALSQNCSIKSLLKFHSQVKTNIKLEDYPYCAIF